MSTISNVNIVVQQAEAGRDVQNVKHQATEANQMAVAQQKEEEEKKKTMVLEAESFDQIAFDDKKDAEKKKLKQKGKKKKKKKDPNVDSTGNILDIIA